MDIALFPEKEKKCLMFFLHLLHLKRKTTFKISPSFTLVGKYLDPIFKKKIPHTGDTNSLDRCG